jgi:hypothetical protein
VLHECPCLRPHTPPSLSYPLQLCCGKASYRRELWTVREKGVQHRLEIFRSATGLGVRTLEFIASGAVSENG